MRFGIVSAVDSWIEKPFSPAALKRISNGVEWFANKSPRFFKLIVIAYASLWIFLHILSWQILIYIPRIVVDCGLLTAEHFGVSGAGKLLTELEGPSNGVPSILHIIAPERSLEMLILVVGLSLFLLALANFLIACLRKPPVGIALLREDAPQLFDMVNKIATRIGIKIDKIVLTNDFNFGASVMPKMIGEQSFLHIGYPALAAISHDQLEGIIAHEAAHLKARHCQESYQFEHCRLSWCNLLNNYRDRLPLLYVPLIALVFWYLPMLGVLTFARSKQQEFDADKLATRVVDPKQYAGALLAFSLKQRLFAAAFSAGLQKLVLEKDLSRSSLFGQATQTVIEADKEKIRSIWSDFYSNADEEISDSHPCLLRRLQSLNYAPAKSENWQPNFDELLNAKSARATSLLGDYAQRIQEKLDRAFLEPNFTTDISQSAGLLSRALAYSENGQEKEAIADLNLAIKKNMLNSDLYILRAQICSQAGQTDQALADCNRVLTFKPACSAAYSIRSFVFTQRKEWTEALADATTAIKMGHNSAYLQSALAKKNLGLIKEAIADMTAALEHRPQEIAYLIYRTGCYEELGDNASALIDIEEAVRLDPDNLPARQVRARLYFKMKMTEKGLADLGHVVEKKNKSGDALVERALALVKAGEEERAREDWQAALLLPIDSAVVLINRAWLGSHFRQWEETLKDSRAAYQRGSRDLSLYLHYGLSLFHTGSYEQSLQLTTEALKLRSDPKFALEGSKLLTLRARVLHALKRDSAALKAIDEAIAAKPTDRKTAIRSDILKSLGREN